MVNNKKHKCSYKSNCNEEKETLKRYFKKLFTGCDVSVKQHNWPGDKLLVITNKKSFNTIHCVIDSEKRYFQNKKEYEKYIESLAKQLLLDYQDD
jgi:hypothetical protein